MVLAWLNRGRCRQRGGTVRLGSPEIAADDLYDVPQPTTAPVQWMGEGGRPVLAYRGGDTAESGKRGPR